MISVRSERDSTEASTIASGRNGITRNHSVSRMSVPSVLPPAYPATIADDGPEHDRDDASRRCPTNRLTRAPHTKSVSTLRPSSSVPNQNSELGDA